MNIKMFLTVTLLGVSLYLGGSSVIYAESAENVTENFEDSFSDCDLEPEMEEDETGFYGGTAEVGFFSADESDNDFEEEPEETPLTPVPSGNEQQILAAIPENATVVTLDVADGSDITETLNTVLHFMGQRATDETPCTVIIPQGSYLISGTIHMYSNLTLYAEGAVLTKSCTDKHVVLRLGDDILSAGGYDGYHNITIEGGTWDLNYPVVEGKEGTGGFVGFRIGHARHVTVKNVTFLNNLKSHFLELAGTEDVTVTGCTFRGYWQEYEGGGQECIQLDACLDYIFPGYQPFDGAVCENVRITDNIFENVFAGVGSHSMIYDRPYRNIVIQGNTFRNVKKRAVWCLNYVDSAVEDNIIENAGGGVLVSCMYFPNTHLMPATAAGMAGNHQNAGISVKNNQISISSVSQINGNTWRGYGIEVQGAWVSDSSKAQAKGIPTGIYKETGVEVKGNMITGNGNGIRLYLADGCTVENNQLKLQKTASFSNMGIYLSASSKNVIKDNQVSGCKNVGIYAYDGGKLGTPSTENQVLDNVISGIGGDGILMENGSDGCEVSRNRISSGKKNGIVLWGSEECQITANQVKGCMLDGIYVENIGNAVIKSNRITNVNGRGIQVIASQTGKLYGNAVTGSRKCGLYVSRSKISGNKKNRLENNGSTYAIYAENSTGIISVKMPTASKITRKSVKITGKAAGGKKLTIYAVSRNKNKKIGRGSINSKKKYNISIKKQKKGTTLLFVLSDKYGNLSYSKRKVK